jgi:hypothetical protein
LGKAGIVQVAAGIGMAIAGGASLPTPNASAVLDVQSSTQGVSIPRGTTAQKNAISNPVEPLFFYDTTLHALCFWNGSTWKTVAGS